MERKEGRWVWLTHAATLSEQGPAADPRVCVREGNLISEFMRQEDDSLDMPAGHNFTDMKFKYGMRMR